MFSQLSNVQDQQQVIECDKQVVDILKRCKQDSILEVIKKFTAKERQKFEQQILKLNLVVSGGLEDYVKRASKLLQSFKDGNNILQDSTISIPQGYELSLSDIEHIKTLEKIGVEEIKDTCFVLITNGNNDKLNFEGADIGLPVELITRQSFLEYYFNYIHAFQSRFGNTVIIPIAIMTNDDNHDQIQQLLQSNNYFDLMKDQVILMKQQKVPTFIDDQCIFTLEKNKLLLETKFHGHGDVHTLLYQAGIIQKWQQKNKKWVIFFQDINPLCFRAFPSILGISKSRNLFINIMTVPRKSGETVESICKITNLLNKKIVTSSIDYTLLEGAIKKEPQNKKGYSLYPANTNCIIFSLSEYSQALFDVKGVVPERVNPIYADPTKTKFSTSVPLESFVLDFTRLMTNNERVAYTQVDQAFCYSPLKNNLQAAVEKQKQNLLPQCAATCEADFYHLNTTLLKLCGAKVVGEPEISEFEGIRVNFGPRVIIDPHIGVTIQELQENIKGVIVIDSSSTLVLRGSIQIENLKLEGILRLEGNGKFNNISIEDKIVHKFQPVDLSESQQPSYIKIRGYNVRKGKINAQFGKCKVEGHNNYQIIAVNLSKEYSGKQRLVCAKCICEQHHQYAQKCIFLSDLMNQSSNDITGWFNQQSQQKISSIENQLSSQVINLQEEFVIVDDLLNSLVENFELQRDLMKNSFNSVKEQREKVISQLQTRFQYLYELKQVFSIYKDYAKKKITKQNLQEQIEKLVKTDERTDTYREMIHIFKMKDKTCPVISKNGLNENVNQIKEQLRLLYHIYKTKSWIFIVPKIGNINQNLKILTYGKQFVFSNIDTQQYLYGSQTFKSPGCYTWSFIIEDAPTNLYNSIYVGIISDQKKDDLNYLLQAGQSAYIDLANQAYSQQFTLLTGKKPMNEIFKKHMNSKAPLKINFKWDTDNKIFQVNDEDMESVHTLTYQKVISQFKNNNYQLGVYTQIFSKETKLRPFVISYQGNFKLTLCD